MLPRLEWAAFNTWVIPNFSRAALFWATALARQKQKEVQDLCGTHTESSFARMIRHAEGVTSKTFWSGTTWLAEQTWYFLINETHTYTFPTYTFGHTSSIWLRCSLQESKTFCRSFTVRYSFLLSFRVGISSPNRLSWISCRLKCLSYYSRLGVSQAPDDQNTQLSLDSYPIWCLAVSLVQRAEQQTRLQDSFNKLQTN